MICPKCKHSPPDGSVFCPQCGKKLTVTQRRRTKSRGNGTGSAYYDPVHHYWIAQVIDGYRPLPDNIQDPENRKQRIPIKKTKGGFKRKEDALAYCKELKNAAPKVVVPALSDYWNIYESNELKALSKSKQSAYKIAWNRLEPLHKYPVNTISVSDLRTVISNSCSTHYTATDCKRVLSALFKLIGADGHASKDLPSYIITPKLEEKERETFTDIEQAALWKLYESGDLRAAPVLLMIYTGMMPGEVIKLRADQIDLEHRQIVGAGMKTKVRKATPIVLAECILPVVEDLIANARPDGRLWTVMDPDDWRNKYYYPALEAAGCRRLTPYSCRHTTATALAITEGIAPQTIKKVMRWSSTRMLDRYAHPDQSDALDAVNTIKKHTV